MSECCFSFSLKRLFNAINWSETKFSISKFWSLMKYRVVYNNSIRVTISDPAQVKKLIGKDDYTEHDYVIMLLCLMFVTCKAGHALKKVLCKYVLLLPYCCHARKPRVLLILFCLNVGAFCPRGLARSFSLIFVATKAVLTGIHLCIDLQ